ncbi:4Fe-4S dicluster domain-containing protein [Nocardia sp. CA-136227]|uniref:4Fe-4S dicluster domain-containing protein n=1 Tax=Nocardia sp. CA-136227 TaxID=3239979 RepID=UPI003D975CA0
MAYVIAAPCVADYSCVEACPIDCIRPRPDDPDFNSTEQLYIDPTSCIECDACVTVCPVSAVHDAFHLPEVWRDYEAVNADYFQATR